MTTSYPQTKEAWVELLRTDVEKFNAAHRQFREQHPLRRLDLKHMDLSDLRCSHADLASTDLDGCRISGAQFKHCNFSNASLRGCVADRMVLFSYCDLTTASFANTYLNMPVFDDSQLNGANFREARLLMPGFGGTQIGHANLHKAILPMSTYDGTRFQSKEQAKLFAARHSAAVDAQPVVEPAPQPSYDVARAQHMIAALRQWLDKAPLPGNDQALPGEGEDIPTFLGSNRPTCGSVIDSVTFAPGDAERPPLITVRVTEPLYRMESALMMALQKAGRYSYDDIEPLTAVRVPEKHEITLSPFELEKLLSALDTPETAQAITQDFHNNLGKYHRIRLENMVRDLSEAFEPKEEAKPEPKISLTEDFEGAMAQMRTNLEAAQARFRAPPPEPVWALTERNETLFLVTDDPIGNLSAVLQAAGLSERQAQTSTWQKAGKTYLSLDAAMTLRDHLREPQVLQSIQQARQNSRS